MNIIIVKTKLKGWNHVEDKAHTIPLGDRLCFIHQWPSKGDFIFPYSVIKEKRLWLSIVIVVVLLSESSPAYCILFVDEKMSSNTHESHSWFHFNK